MVSGGAQQSTYVHEATLVNTMRCGAVCAWGPRGEERLGIQSRYTLAPQVGSNDIHEERRSGQSVCEDRYACARPERNNKLPSESARASQLVTDTELYRQSYLCTLAGWQAECELTAYDAVTFGFTLTAL